jgi:hypothetical protein
MSRRDYDGYDWRRTRAIRAARRRRTRELAPLHAQIAAAIEQIGWRTARPLVIAIVGHAHGGRHGGWWHKVGKRNGTKLLAALHAVPLQPTLFDETTGTEATRARAPPCTHHHPFPEHARRRMATSTGADQ